MSETLFSAVRTRFNDRARDQMALGLWFSVLAGVLFLSTAGQSVPITAGLMLQLTGAYSTFVLCGKTERSLFVHIVPYAFALTGMAFLCLAPDFRNAIQASLAFLAVTVLMHASVVHGLRKNLPETGESVRAGVN
jgi:hypothetical protein